MRSAYIEQNSGAGGYLAPYQRITAAVTLTAVEDSGKGFLLDSAGGAYSITLPTATTAAEGTNYKFWVEENTPTGAITIAAGSAIIFGKVNETEVDTSDDGPGSNGATGVSNVILGTSAIKGDFLDFTFSHGAYWMFGSSAADGAVTTS
jgi:hypothetical protein